MGILLAFAPFMLYVAVEWVAGVRAGLIAAAVVSAGLLLRDAFSRERKAKILEIGTFLLFAGLAGYAFWAGAAWSIPAVRLRVDSGLLLIVVLSMVVRQPFTLQYAREKVARELWSTPGFERTNYIITAVWAAAFAVMVAADLVLLDVPSLPRRFAVIVTILAIYGAVRFTTWYPDRRRATTAD